MPSSCCEITGRVFTEEDAKRAIRKYRADGPPNPTREILRAVRLSGPRDATVLDIGGGVGVIHHELLQDVARQAIHVDASAAYLDEARAESARRGHLDRVQFIHADFTDVASTLSQADIVTLDRVVCCYPDFRALLADAAQRSERLLALTYPRETWYGRIGLKIVNGFQRLRRDPFRVFLHPVREMDAVLRAHGLQRRRLTRFFFWEMALYSRT